MERFSEQALVLSTVDYGDADRIVTLFTRGRGKLSAWACRKASKSAVARRFSSGVPPPARAPRVTQCRRAQAW